MRCLARCWNKARAPSTAVESELLVPSASLFLESKLLVHPKNYKSCLAFNSVILFLGMYCSHVQILKEKVELGRVEPVRGLHSSAVYSSSN